MLSDLLQVLMSGLALGGVYTLLAMGLFLTYATSRALNFGQGDFLALSAFLGMAGLTAGWPLWLVVLGVTIILSLLGVMVEGAAVRPVLSHKGSAGGHLGWIVTTLGFGMILQNVISMVWGKSRYFSPPLFSTGQQQLVKFWGARVYLEELAIGGIALALVGIMYVLMYKSNWGRRVAAVSFDKDTAQLLGINVRGTIIGAYIVMAVLSAVAGLLIGPLSAVQSHMGMIFLLKAFAVISIGGFSNPLGLLIGGLAFGAIESFSNYFDSEFGDLFPFLIVMGFLLFRPMGIFSESKTDVR